MLPESYTRIRAACAKPVSNAVQRQPVGVSKKLELVQSVSATTSALNSKKTESKSPSLCHKNNFNPKRWTPAEISMYLTASLNTGGHDLPTPVARDIAAFVRDKKITGKSFFKIE